MKRNALSLLLIPVFSVFFFTTCLNPLEYDPTTALATINITGHLTTEDVTSAVLMISNRSNTIDVTNITITQPEVLNSGTIAIINGKPVHRTTKAQYVKPSDVDYHIIIEYRDFADSDNPEEGILHIDIATPMPKTEYWLFLYRTVNGVIVVGKEFGGTVGEPDPGDTSVPSANLTQDPLEVVNDGEGAIGGYIPLDPITNKPISGMGVLVVVNVTTDTPINAVDLGIPDPTEEVTPPALPTSFLKKFRMSNEPRPGDQQGITLGSGFWQTSVTYTYAGVQYTTSSKNAQVMPLTESVQAANNYLYFYKTNRPFVNGRPVYDITTSWPPLLHDEDQSNNIDSIILNDDQAILNITNRSTSEMMIHHIMIDGVEYRDINLYPEESKKFIVSGVSAEKNSVEVSFKPERDYPDGNDPSYGLPQTVTGIVAQRTRDFAYRDNMGNLNTIPTSKGFGAGLIRIENKSGASGATVYSVTIIDPQDPMGPSLTIPYWEFNPKLPINANEKGRLYVYGTEDFPLSSTKNYLIQVEMADSNRYFREYYRTIDNKNVLIEINGSNLVQGESTTEDRKFFGSVVTVENQVALTPGASPLYITGMQVYNAEAANQKFYYSSGEMTSTSSLDIGIANGEDAEVYVLSSPQMPIIQGANYKVDIFISGNNSQGIIHKDFTGGGDLYSSDPASHRKTVTITNADIPDYVASVFTPVTGIQFNNDPDVGKDTSHAIDITSTVLRNTSTLVGPGVFNLNTAVVLPIQGLIGDNPDPDHPGATNTTITWTKTGSNTGYYSIGTDGLLTVTQGALVTQTIQIQVTATIANGTAAGTPYTKSFYFNLKYTGVGADDVKVSSITKVSDIEIYIGQQLNLLGYVSIPANAVINNRPTTREDITFSWPTETPAKIGRIGGGTSTIIEGQAAGTVTVTATLAGTYTTSGTAITQTINVTVKTAGAGSAEHYAATGITFTPALSTVTTSVMASTSTIVSAGHLNLNTAVVAPAHATNKFIDWEVVSTNNTDTTVSVTGGVLVVTKAPTVGAAGSAAISRTATIRATIKGGGATAETNYTTTFTVNLSFTVYSYTNRVTKIDMNITKTNNEYKMYLYEQDLKSLLYLVKFTTVSGQPFLNGVAITVNDIVWEIGTSGAQAPQGGGKVTISGSNVTGVTAGIVFVRARLDIAKGGGSNATTGGIVYSEWISITIWSVPQISQNAKAAFWFLFTSLNDGIVFVPTTDKDGNPYFDTIYDDTARLTGITNVKWTGGDAKYFNKTEFLKKFPNAIVSGRLSTMGYTPGVAYEGQPRPMLYPDSGMYYVFFMKQEAGKADMQIYGNGPTTVEGNTLFLLDVQNKGPQIVLQPQSGSTKNTAMKTSKITWDPSLTGVITESQASNSLTAGQDYFNNMGIPMGIYRFQYWGNKIEFINGVFAN